MQKDTFDKSRFPVLFLCFYTRSRRGIKMIENRRMKERLTINCQ